MRKILTALMIMFCVANAYAQTKTDPIYSTRPLPADSIPLTEYFGRIKKWEFKTTAFIPQSLSKKTHHSFIMVPEKFEYKRRYTAAFSKQPQPKRSYLVELAGAVTDALMEEYLWKRTLKSLYSPH